MANTARRRDSFLDSETEGKVMSTILCAVDRSPGAAEALQVATSLKESLRGRLVLAHVAEGYRLPHGEAGVTGRHAEQGAKRLLDQVAAEHGLNGDVDRRAEVGDRAAELARVAREEAAMLIVLGSRRQGLFGRQLSSSLAAELRAIAPCAVVVVPPEPRG